MTKYAYGAWRALPLALLLVLYWPSLTTWFFADDFGWLNLRHDVVSAADLPAALFAPKAHGNMRPLGENLYWLGLGSVFGADPLPFHICTFLTAGAGVILLGAIARRLAGSQAAGFAAQVLWVVNCGLAPSLGWSSIYNQVLCGFLLLLALFLLLRYQETGRRAYLFGQWAAFALSLGALETSVVYPALAAAYALLFARRLLDKVLPMFALSAAAAFVHLKFAPLSAGGAYSPRVDLRLFDTLATYWTWALGPARLATFGWLTSGAALALTGLLTVSAAALAAWGIRRREFTAVFGLAWFVIALGPYLVLPEHKMDYYLAVPAIGLALAGAWAVECARVSGSLPRRIAFALPLAAYLAASVPASASAARWMHDRAEKAANLVLGAEEVRAANPRALILLDGVDTDLFWSGVADLPFRALGISSVYLAPGSEARIEAPRDLLSKYILPEAIARRALDGGSAVVYRFDGEMLRNATVRFRTLADAGWREEAPHFVNLGDPVFGAYVGAGWRDAVRGTRWMSGSAVFTIGTPRGAAESLYLGVFRTRPFGWSIRVNGTEVPAALVHRDNDLSEFRIPVPAPAAAAKQMEVAVRSEVPLEFGYAEVR